MMRGIKIEGINKVIRNLNKESGKMKSGIAQGMIESAIEIRRAMDTQEPKIPVDTGNLRSSWFVTTSFGKGRGQNPSFSGDNSGELASNHSRVLSSYQNETAAARKMLLIMGFTANYTLKVHEAVDQTNWNRRGSGPKFFQTHLENSQMKIINLLQKRGKI